MTGPGHYAKPKTPERDRHIRPRRHRAGYLAAEIDPDEVVRDAAASCPSEAISLVDADAGEPVDLDQ